MMPTPTTEAPTHAVVIGGSVAGLLAARTLSDHYARVTVLDRDALPSGVAQRRGVPQGRHTHGLLAGGSAALERLFPGFTQEMVSRGAIDGDVVADVLWHFEGAPLARTGSGLQVVMATRPFLESRIRERVRTLANLTFRDGVTVEGLTTDGASAVTGVRLTGGESLHADLVVDASGRGSHAPAWLRAMGYEAPEEDRVTVSLGYCTRRFARDPRALGGALGIVVPPTPLGKRGGVMAAQEGNIWTVTLISQFGPPAPLDLDGFIDFAASLPSREIHSTIRAASPVGDAVASRFPGSVRRRYERLRRFPSGLVVTGDAVCSFNPIYGQGMSVAALEAEALGQALAEGRHALATRFFRAASRIVDIPWTTAVGNDLRVPEVEGPRPLPTRLINAYIERFHRVAHTDAELATAFLRVGNLMAPPASLLAPRHAWKVARAALQPARVDRTGTTSTLAARP